MSCVSLQPLASVFIFANSSSPFSSFSLGPVTRGRAGDGPKGLASTTDGLAHSHPLCPLCHPCCFILESQGIKHPSVMVSIFDGQSLQILKVPLIIFKREKKIARRLELETHLSSQDKGEGWFEQWWDSFVVQSPSFPNQYWDKQVKWRVSGR